MATELVRLSAMLLLALGIGHVATGAPWWTGLGLAAAVVGVEAVRGQRLGRLRDLLTIAAHVVLLTAAALAVIEGPVGRARGFTHHANQAAAMALAMTVVAALGARPTRWGSVLQGASVACGAIAVVLAGSRVALLGAGCTGIIVAAAHLSRTVRGRRWIALGVALAGAALLGTLTWVASTREDLRSGIASGAGERLLLYDVALDIAGRSPWLGLGEEAWRRWQPIVEPSLPPTSAAHVHSVPLLFLIEGGSAGFVAATVVLGAACVGLARRYVRRRSVGAAVALSALGGLALQSLVDLTATHWLVYAPLMAAAVLTVAAPDDRVFTSAHDSVDVGPTS